MSSKYSPRWLRFLYRYMPFLFKKCPAGNYHWRWDKICWCMLHEHCGEKGGLYIFSNKKWYLEKSEVYEMLTKS